MEQPNWQFAFASVIGNAHLSENIPLQDNCSVETYDNYSIAVVADGAGSCKNSDKGSRAVVGFAIYHFKALVEKWGWQEKDELPDKSDWHELAKGTLFAIKEDLEKLSINEEVDFKSLSCTIIITIVLKSGLLVTHIGDGRAGFCNADNEWKSSITPYHGELANQTVFITSEIWEENRIDYYIESNIIKEDVIAFCLLTDGCEKASYACNYYNQETEKYYDPNLPFAPFFDPNLKVLKQLNQQRISQEQVNLLWSSFLSSGNSRLKQESDDKTLILGVKVFDVIKEEE